MDNIEEEVIKLFRKEVAEEEGISEEEAGAKINKDVEIALDVMNPLLELHRKIGKRAETNAKEALRITMMAITHLLMPFDVETRRMVLNHIISKIGDMGTLEEIDDKLKKYLKDK